MSPEKEELFRRLEAWFETMSPAEQELMGRVLEKIGERSKTMSPEAFKAWLEQVFPLVAGMPYLLRLLNS
jgi:hypothetical protein